MTLNWLEIVPTNVQITVKHAQSVVRCPRVTYTEAGHGFCISLQIVRSHWIFSWYVNGKNPYIIPRLKNIKINPT